MTLIRRTLAIFTGLMLIIYGLFRLVALWAENGWPMSINLRESIVGYINGISHFQQVLLSLLFIALPVGAVALWWIGRRADRLIKVGEGTHVQESAITHFLKTSLEPLPEVHSIRAHGRMSEKGLILTCDVGVVTDRPLADIKERLAMAVRAVMSERLGIVPLANVLINVKDIRADKATTDIAREAAARQRPTSEPKPDPKPEPTPSQTPSFPSAPPEPETVRETIDLSPPMEEELDDDPPDKEPM